MMTFLLSKNPGTTQKNKVLGSSQGDSGQFGDEFFVVDNFRMNTRSGRYGATYNMVALLLF
jgi:hypothetical protein